MRNNVYEKPRLIVNVQHLAEYFSFILSDYTSRIFVQLTFSKHIILLNISYMAARYKMRDS